MSYPFISVGHSVLYLNSLIKDFLFVSFENKAIFGAKHAFDQAEPVSANLAFQKSNMLQLFTEYI